MCYPLRGHLATSGDVGFQGPRHIRQVFHHCLRVFIAVIKHHDQKQLGEKRAYFILQLTACHEREVREGAQSWNQRRSYGGTLLTGLFPLAFPACSLIPLKTTCPFTSIKNIPSDIPQTNQMQAFSQSRVLFPDNSSLCSINKILTSMLPAHTLRIKLHVCL